MKTFAWLPQIYRAVAEAAGLEAALRLAAEHGGTRIYVPKAAGPEHWLTLLIGPEGAAALCERIGGENVTLPVDPNGGVKAMRRRAERALDEGLSADEAARRSRLLVAGDLFPQTPPQGRKPLPRSFPRFRRVRLKLFSMEARAPRA